MKLDSNYKIAIIGPKINSYRNFHTNIEMKVERETSFSF